MNEVKPSEQQTKEAVAAVLDMRRLVRRCLALESERVAREEQVRKLQTQLDLKTQEAERLQSGHTQGGARSSKKRPPCWLRCVCWPRRRVIRSGCPRWKAAWRMSLSRRTRSSAGRGGSSRNSTPSIPPGPCRNPFNASRLEGNHWIGRCTDFQRNKERRIS